MTAIDAIIQQGINENTANSARFEKWINQETKALLASFLYGLEPQNDKLKTFLLEGEGLFGSSEKYMIEKPTLNEVVGGKITYDYLKDLNPTAAGQSGKKKVENSENGSSLPQQQMIRARIEQLKRNFIMFRSNAKTIIADIAGIDTDTITFATPQMIEISQIVKVAGVLYEVIAESEEGITYQLDAEPSVTAKTCIYSFDNTTLKNAAFNFHFTLLNIY